MIGRDAGKDVACTWLLAAAAYFAAVFAVGLTLGAAREWGIRPHVGTLASIAIEAPAMLLACWVSARLVVRRFAITTPGDRMRMGALAFALLIVAELLGSLALRGMSPGQWLAHFAEPAGFLSLSLFVAFAAMPVVVKG